ncbi:FtsX-like permease family protein [Nonomuraea sp. NPDC049709]|uniref:FtsX-like permease family protein n=1 Tax=Nonomuraea sp. NPDC049709 TaxID=3154736 RepID=UPI00342B4096
MHGHRPRAGRIGPRHAPHAARRRGAAGPGAASPPEHAALRLLGAAKGQVLRYIMAEALLVVAVGAVLAAVATGLGLLGLYAALAQLSGPVAIDVPWQPVTGVIGLCGVLAVLTAVLPASRTKTVAIPRA